MTKTGYSCPTVKVRYRQVVSKTKGDARGIQRAKEDRDRATRTEDTPATILRVSTKYNLVSVCDKAMGFTLNPAFPKIDIIL